MGARTNIDARLKQLTPARGRVRAGYTKNHNQGQSKQRRKMAKASKRRNRGK